MQPSRSSVFVLLRMYTEAKATMHVPLDPFFLGFMLLLLVLAVLCGLK